MLCTQNIIIDKVRHTVAEDRIGIFINCFLCVLLVPQTRFLDKKNIVPCAKTRYIVARATSAILLDCTIGVYEFSSKICFGNKKLLSLTKYVTLLQRSESVFLSTVFCVLLVPQTRFSNKKPYTVCKNSLHFCVRHCTTKDEVWKKTFP